MEIRRFFVDKEDVFADKAVVKGDEFFHLKNVLRLKKGFKVVLSAGDGTDLFCEIVEIGKDEALCEIKSREKNLTETAVDVTLYAAVPKGGKLDFIAQKAVELGVSRLVAYVSQNCAEKSVNIERLKKIVLEASKQCGRAKVMEIAQVATFAEALSGCNSETKLLFCEFENKTNFGDFKLKGSTAVMVGSEGGFTNAEYEAAVQSGFRSVSLGRRILRTETAAVAAVTLAMYELGELKL